MTSAELDAKYAALMVTECSTPDWECNGSRRDGLIRELLRDLGLTLTLAAYTSVNTL